MKRIFTLSVVLLFAVIVCLSSVSADSVKPKPEEIKATFQPIIQPGPTRARLAYQQSGAQGETHRHVPSHAEVLSAHLEEAMSAASYVDAPQYRRDAAKRLDQAIAREARLVGYQEEIGGSSMICLYCGCGIGEHVIICNWLLTTFVSCHMHPANPCVWYDPNKLLPGGGGVG